MQTFPAIVARLYTVVPPLGAGHRLGRGHGVRHRRRVPAAGPDQHARRASTDTVPVINHTIYIGLTGLVINLVIAVVLTS